MSRRKTCSKSASLCQLDNKLAPHYGKFTGTPCIPKQYGSKLRPHAITLTYKNICTLKEGKAILMNHMKIHAKVYCVFYPEYTETGRLHWHGTVWESNKQRYNQFLSYWKYTGFFKESKLSMLLAWHLYCTKDQYLFKRQPSRVSTPSVNHHYRHKLYRSFNYYFDNLKLIP